MNFLLLRLHDTTMWSSLGGLLWRNPARRNGDRQGHNQKPREMMRPDIDRVEVQCERQHHHRVLRARRERRNTH